MKLFKRFRLKKLLPISVIAASSIVLIACGIPTQKDKIDSNLESATQFSNFFITFAIRDEAIKMTNDEFKNNFEVDKTTENLVNIYNYVKKIEVNTDKLPNYDKKSSIPWISWINTSTKDKDQEDWQKAASMWRFAFGDSDQTPAVPGSTNIPPVTSTIKVTLNLLSGRDKEFTLNTQLHNFPHDLTKWKFLPTGYVKGFDSQGNPEYAKSDDFYMFITFKTI